MLFATLNVTHIHVRSFFKKLKNKKTKIKKGKKKGKNENIKNTLKKMKNKAKKYMYAKPKLPLIGKE